MGESLVLEKKLGYSENLRRCKIFCYSLVCTWKSGGGSQISCFLQELVLLKRCCPVNLCLFMQILEGFIEGVSSVLPRYLPLGHAQWIVRQQSQLAAIKECFGSICVCVYIWLNQCLLGPSGRDTSVLSTYHGFQLNRLFKESFQQTFNKVFCVFDSFRGKAAIERQIFLGREKLITIDKNFNC